MAQMETAADAVRAQLERILASGTFASATRHARLLRYLVERTLAGAGDQLKEYVLGTEVFDRPESYDPRLDSIVRVEVRRLRSRLEEYYRTEGASDPVLITIPRGNYAPLFEGRPAATNDVVRGAAEERSAADAASTVRDEGAPPRHRSMSRIVASVAAVAVVGVVVAALLDLNQDQRLARASTGAGIAVLPFEHYSTSEQDALLAKWLTDETTTALARIGTVSVASRTSAARFSSGSQSAEAVGTALDVDFLVEANAVFEEQNIRVTARLVDCRLDRKVWVGEYVIRRSDVSSGARRIASEAAGAVIEYHDR
jgi:TolB-like protein